MMITSILSISTLTYWILPVVIAISFSLYLFCKKKTNLFEDHGVPQVPGKMFIKFLPIPFISRKHITDYSREVYNLNSEAKYIGMMEFRQPVIIVRDLELIKSITIKNFDCFLNHRMFFDSSLDPLFGGNLFSLHDDQWRETRALLSPTFTASKMKGMHELLTDCAKNVIDYLIDLPVNERKMISTKDLFGKYTTDAIATCGFGLSINSLRNPENDFYVFGKQAANLDNRLLIFKLMISTLFPWLAKLLNIKFFNDRIAAFFKNIVQTSVEERDKSGVSRPDVIQLMMNARGKTNSNLKLDNIEMTAHVLIFFLGGFESTSTQMCSIAHELAINPDIQKKLQDEIDEVMKMSSGNPTYENINELPYLDAVFNESMRLHTINSNLDRICTKSFELPPALPESKPLVIQPGTPIQIPSWAIHRDPKYYENPDEFDPDRYYGKRITMNDESNLGFGIGPRSCIGNRFAILETKIMFTYLLYKFNLKPNKKTCNPFKYDRNVFTIKPVGGFWLSIEPRDL